LLNKNRPGLQRQVAAKSLLQWAAGEKGSQLKSASK
jgi:hypothetical protein